MNDPVYKQMTDFLLELGIAEMSHTSKTGHLLAVYRLLNDQAGVDACRAGIFHSIYGTEELQRFRC